MRCAAPTRVVWDAGHAALVPGDCDRWARWLAQGKGGWRLQERCGFQRAIVEEVRLFAAPSSTPHGPFLIILDYAQVYIACALFFPASLYGPSASRSPARCPLAKGCALIQKARTLCCVATCHLHSGRFATSGQSHLAEMLPMPTSLMLPNL